MFPRRFADELDFGTLASSPCAAVSAAFPKSSVEAADAASASDILSPRSRAADNCQSVDDEAIETGPLQLCGGVGMIPHPDKAHRGGEDAFFLLPNGMGVADGVGSWSLQGIDAGLFARSLMLESRKVVDAGALHPGKIMERAHNVTKARGLKGSSTAVVLVLEGNVLHSANLGDSSFMVIRDGNVVFKSKEQTHGFNTPYQLSHEAAGGDKATSACLHSMPLHPGDVILAGTDGLFDNLYQSQILALVTESLTVSPTTATTLAHTPSPGRGDDASEQDQTSSVSHQSQHQPPQVHQQPDLEEKIQALAERIAEKAHRYAARRTGKTPFGDAAAKCGMMWNGGKMDDITLCVAVVRPAASSTGAPAKL